MFYLLTVLRPRDYDPSEESKEMRAAIDHLNEHMVAAGIRRFVGGLQDPSRGITIYPKEDKAVALAALDDVPAATIGGLWILEVESQEEALKWSQAAADACRATVQARPFH